MNLTESTRAYIYRIVLAIFAVLILYGLIAPDQLPVWTEIAAAILAFGTNGLATANTSTDSNAP